MQGLKTSVLLLVSIILPLLSFSQTEECSKADFQRAISLFENKKYQQANIIFSNLQSCEQINDHDLIDYYLLLSHCHLSPLETDTLFLQFENTHLNTSNIQSARYHLSQHLFSIHKYAQLIKIWEKAQHLLNGRSQQKMDQQFWLAKAFYHLNDIEKAYTHFKILKGGSHTHKEASCIYFSLLEVQKGNYTEAIPYLEKNLQNIHHRSEIILALTLCYYYTHQPQKAIDLLTIKYRRTRRFQQHHLYLALSFFELYTYEKAKYHFEQYFKLIKKDSPIDRGVSFRYAHCLNKLKRFTQAIPYYKLALKGRDIIAQKSAYELGELYHFFTDYQAAAKAFNRARLLSFDSDIKEKSCYYFASLSMKNHAYSDAIESCKQYIANHPNGLYLKSIKDIKGKAYENSGNYYDAIEYMEPRLANNRNLHEKYQKATYNIACLSFNDTKFSIALKYGLKSANYPVAKQTLSNTNYLIAECYSSLGNFQKALSFYTQCKIGIKSHLIHYSKGYAYYHLKQYDNAENEFTKFLLEENIETYEREIKDALLRIADCQYHSSKFDEAKTSYHDAISKNGHEADYILYQIAQCHYNQSKIDSAIHFYDKTIHFFKPSIYKNWAKLQKAIILLPSQPKLALRTFHQLHNTIRPTKVGNQALYHLCKYHFSREEYSKSIPLLKKIITHVHSDIERKTFAYEHISHIKNIGLLFEDISEINTNYLSYLHQATDTSANSQLANAIALAKESKHIEAIAILNNLLTQKNHYSSFQSELHYHLGLSLESLGEYKKSIYHYNLVTSSKKWKANLHSCELNFSLGKYNEALNAYLKLKRTTTSKDLKSIALIGCMRCSEAIDDYQAVIQFAKEAKKIGVDEYQQHTQLMQVNALNELHQYKEASDIIRKITLGARSEYALKAHLLQADIYRKNSQYIYSIDEIDMAMARYASYQTQITKAKILKAKNLISLHSHFEAENILLILQKNNTSSFSKQIQQLLNLIDSKTYAISSPTSIN